MSKKITVEIEVWRVVGIIIFTFIGLLATFSFIQEKFL